MTGARIGDRPRVLVAGAGVAGLEFVLALEALAPERFEVEVVAPEEFFTYRPFAVAETFTLGPGFHVGLDAVFAQLGVDAVRDSVRAIDAEGRSVLTASGAELPYDVLLIACGGRPRQALDGALTFGGEADTGPFRALLWELEDGRVQSAAFVVPAGPSWVLPVYELALLTAARLNARGVTGRRLSLVTPEPAPLALFGARAAGMVADLLAVARIDVHCGRYVAAFEAGGLRLVPEGEVAAEEVVTVPTLAGPALEGLASDRDGFLIVDLHGVIHGSEDMLAAGDAIAFPFKQGGLAAQQADATAAAVAAHYGWIDAPTPFRPVLRGLLLTGGAPRFLWAKIAGGEGDASAAETFPLWWPPSKIAGGYLARFLRDELGLPVPPPAGPAATPVDVTLDAPRPRVRRRHSASVGGAR